MNSAEEEIQAQRAVLLDANEVMPSREMNKILIAFIIGIEKKLLEITNA